VPATFPQPLQQTQRMWPSWCPRLAWSQQKMRPHRRMSMKDGRRHLPGWWKPPKLQPPSRSLSRRKPLSEKRGHRHPVQLPPKSRVSRLGAQ
jgi:hypothetical protein